MLKRMYIVISLLSSVALIHAMDNEVGKRSAGEFLNETLDIVVGKIEKEVSGTITTVEHELGILAQEAKQELTLLGVTPKGAYEGMVVFAALYLTAETGKYIYNRYFAPQEPPIDTSILSIGKTADDAQSRMHVLGQFVSTTQINAIVEAKWKEMMGQANLADKGYVDTATAQVRNMVTPALETNANRVTALEKNVGVLTTILRGDPKVATPGLINAHGILANRIVALENQKQSASSSSAAAHTTDHDKSGGVMSKLFGRKKTKRDDSGIHGVPGDKQSHGDDDDDEDGVAITDLHATGADQDKKKDTL